MTPRKRRGVSFFISGAVFLVGGFLSFKFQSDPGWFATVIALVGLVASFFGFTTVFPDTE